MIIRIACVEDCAEDRIVLEQYLHRLSAEEDMLRVSSFTNGEDFLEAAASQSFDLIFMDIWMDTMTGMETAQRLRAFDRHALIVFLTQTSDYLAEGYKVRGFRYILKPIRMELLEECLQDARLEFSILSRDMVAFGEGARRTRIPAEDILYICASANYITVHSTNEVLRFRERIGDMEGRLPAQFVSIHRSDIVNVQHVVKLEADAVTMTDGQQLGVSRRHRQKLREKFAAFH